MSKVNLDALIPREDFISHGEKTNKQSQLTKLTLGHLMPTEKQNYISIYHLLRKPDFQRETNEWDKERIADLIECFMGRSFIPSIILWENQESGKIFVIDGAHRLSALIAYINDDYGDRSISQKFYKYNSSSHAEIELAEETRTYINRRIGSFDSIMTEGGKKADGLRTAAFDLQIIPGDVELAEDSFFKINQQGVVLSPTERDLCKNRTKPSCIATRAIIKGKAGNQYWNTFDISYQPKIKEAAEELNILLFTPPYSQNVKSAVLHHPLGGHITIATPMIFEFMKIKIPNFHLSRETIDKSGFETLNYLTWAKTIVRKILSEQPGSLGLFPSIYFYNNASVYIQSAFLGMVLLLVENEKNRAFLPRFTKVRSRMESFLIKYKVFITQINRKYGSKERSHRHMKGFFAFLIDILNENENLDQDGILLKVKEKYSYLNELELDTEKSKSRKFSKEQKISISIREELDGMAKCKICGGHLHPLSKDFDHKIDLKFGGGSDDANVQTTHIYCNNSKDLLTKLRIYQPQNN